MKKSIAIVLLLILLLYSSLFASTKNKVQVIWCKSFDGKFIIFNAYDREDIPAGPESISALLIEVDPEKQDSEGGNIYQNIWLQEDNSWYLKGDKIPFYGLYESKDFLDKIGLTADTIIEFRKKYLESGNTKALFREQWANIIKKFTSTNTPFNIGDKVVIFTELTGLEYEVSKKEIKNIFKKKTDHQPVFPHFKYGIVAIIKVNGDQIDSNFMSQNIEFNDVVEGKTIEKKIILKNIGHEIVAVSESETNSFVGNFKPSQRKFFLSPLAEKEIVISYQAPYLQRSSDENYLRDITVKLKISNPNRSHLETHSYVFINLRLLANILPQVNKESSGKVDYCYIRNDTKDDCKINFDFDKISTKSVSEAKSLYIINYSDKKIVFTREAKGYGTSFESTVGLSFKAKPGEEKPVDVKSVKIAPGKGKLIRVRFSPRDEYNEKDLTKNRKEITVTYKVSDSSKRIVLNLRGDIQRRKISSWFYVNKSFIIAIAIAIIVLFIPIIVRFITKPSEKLEKKKVILGEATNIKSVVYWIGNTCFVLFILLIVYGAYFISIQFRAFFYRNEIYNYYVASLILMAIVIIYCIICAILLYWIHKKLRKYTKNSGGRSLSGKQTGISPSAEIDTTVEREQKSKISKGLTKELEAIWEHKAIPEHSSQEYNEEERREKESIRDIRTFDEIIDELERIGYFSGDFINELVSLRNKFWSYQDIQKKILRELNLFKDIDEIINGIRKLRKIEYERNSFIEELNQYFSEEQINQFNDLDNLRDEILERLRKFNGLSNQYISFRNDVKEVIQKIFSNVVFSSVSDDSRNILDRIESELKVVKDGYDNEISDMKKEKKELNETLTLKQKEVSHVKNIRNKILEAFNPITKFLKTSNEQVVEMAGSDENIFQDHVNFIQKNELYMPKYIQNYESLLTYFHENFTKINDNIRKESRFIRLFQNVLEGENGNTGVKRAIAKIGNTQDREALYNNLLINHPTEFESISKKVFFKMHLKRYFLPVLNDFYRIILYHNISSKDFDLRQQFSSDGINLEILKYIEGYTHCILDSNFDIHLPPLKLFEDKFDETIHDPTPPQGRSIIVGLSPECKTMHADLEKNIIYDLYFIGIKSNELGIDERHKVLYKY